MTQTTFPLSSRLIANVGPAYTDAFIGHPAQFVTYEGDTLVGVVEDVRLDGVVVRFPDGRWARGPLDSTVIQSRG